jgi:hypothetical protein
VRGGAVRRAPRNQGLLQQYRPVGDIAPPSSHTGGECNLL